MKHPIQPTFAVRETKESVEDFIFQNKINFGDILRPLLFWIFSVTLLNIVISASISIFLGSDYGFLVGYFAMLYLLSVLSISWHRVVILGGEQAQMMKSFKPQKHEIIFMLVPFVLGVINVLIMFVSLSFSQNLPSHLSQHSDLIFNTTAFILSAIAIYGFLKVSFYLPAKAIDNSISFKQAFCLTKGYIGKLSIVTILLSVKYVFLIICLLLIMGILIIIFSAIAINVYLANLVLFSLVLPIVLYLIPKMTIIWVVVLSNYYLHAMQKQS